MTAQLITATQSVLPPVMNQAAVSVSSETISSAKALTADAKLPYKLKTYFPLSVNDSINDACDFLSGNARVVLVSLLAMHKGEGWKGSVRAFANHIQMNEKAVRKALEELASDNINLITIIKKKKQLWIRPNCICLNKVQFVFLSKTSRKALHEDDFECVLGSSKAFRQVVQCDMLLHNNAALQKEDEVAAIRLENSREMAAEDEECLADYSRLKTYFPMAVHYCLNAAHKPLSGNSRIILITLLAINEGRGWLGSVSSFADYMNMNQGIVRRAIEELSAPGVGLVVKIKAGGKTLLWPNWVRLNKQQEQCMAELNARKKRESNEFVCLSKDASAFEDALLCRQFMKLDGCGLDDDNSFAVPEEVGSESRDNTSVKAGSAVLATAGAGKTAAEPAAVASVMQPAAAVTSGSSAAAHSQVQSASQVSTDKPAAQPAIAQAPQAQPAPAVQAAQSTQSAVRNAAASSSAASAVPHTAQSAGKPSASDNKISVNILATSRSTVARAEAAREHKQSVQNLFSGKTDKPAVQHAVPASGQTAVARQPAAKPAGSASAAAQGTPAAAAQQNTAPAPANAEKATGTAGAAQPAAVQPSVQNATRPEAGTKTASAAAAEPSQQIPRTADGKLDLTNMQIPGFSEAKTRQEQMDIAMEYLRKKILSDKSSAPSGMANTQAAAPAGYQTGAAVRTQAAGQAKTAVVLPAGCHSETNIVKQDLVRIFKTMDLSKCGLSPEILANQMMYHHEHKSYWTMNCDGVRVNITQSNLVQACKFWLKGAEMRAVEKGLVSARNSGTAGNR